MIDHLIDDSDCYVCAVNCRGNCVYRAPDMASRYCLGSYLVRLYTQTGSHIYTDRYTPTPGAVHDCVKGYRRPSGHGQRPNVRTRNQILLRDWIEKQMRTHLLFSDLGPDSLIN